MPAIPRSLSSAEAPEAAGQPDPAASHDLGVPEFDRTELDGPAAARERQVAQLEQRLVARMTGLDPALHEDLARAIQAEAEAERIDPLLVLAVIEIESGYDPSAVSAGGAVGLMQLLPGTLRRETEGRGVGAGVQGGPVDNVRAGVRYIRRCLDSYPDTGVALMAYNAGPNRLYGWLQAGAVPLEVRGYAKRVLATYQRLRLTTAWQASAPTVDQRPAGG